MKSNYFKYIFIIFAIIIMVFAIVKMKTQEQKSEIQIYEEKEDDTAQITEIALGIAEFDSINPILSKNKNVQDISKIIFEPLMTISSNYKLEMCLASEWAKQNSTTYLVKLKDNKRWSNGEIFTAIDVKYTIDKLKEIDSIYSANVQHIANIEVVDETTVRIILDQEVPFFEYNLTFPILSSIYYSDKEFTPDIVPIGTGMYEVSEVQDSALILSKNEYYSEIDELKLDKITINLYSSVGELYNSFKIGNVDLLSTQNNNLQDYIGTIGYFSKEMKGREHEFIAFNTQNPILSQVDIRRAISYSIDKANIVSSVYSDKYYTSNFPLDYGNWLYENQESSSGYNTEQAKQLLVDNGWEYKYKNWQKIVDYRMQRLSFNFVVNSTYENQVQVAENIKTQLENQGIRINLIKATNEQYQEYKINKNYDMILCSMNLSISPNLSTFFGENNLANYSSEELSNIMNEIKNTTDEEKIKQDYKYLSNIYMVEMPYLSLYNNKYTVVYSTNLSGTIEPNWFNQFYNLKDWHK